MKRFRFGTVLPWRAPFTAGDGLIFLGIAALLYAGARLAFAAPRSIAGPSISTSPAALPWYALLSIGRMLAAYCLSLTFSLFYGHAAARRRAAGRVLLPLLDVLQSVPILSFLPVVLLGLSALLPSGLAAELAAIVLIFTSQAWNMTFSFYQSMTTIPGDLREAASIFRFDPWLRFKTLDLPFAAVGLIWNSMMSWAGGWFFLMAAEIYNVGARDFRLPGL
ncbi:MAG TPA: ABC transporter permease subunit, partial [Candidatus Polarisedimenticolia bacterium]|nr:ABC transporter permease subunit [Candidatus Polarisedimenticolia bacterium]